MRRHPKALAEAGICEDRYTELRAVCRQYEKYRRDVARQRAGLVDRGGGNAPWQPEDPTGDLAVSLAWSPEARRVKIIEACAREAAGDVVGRALLRSVTESASYDVVGPPCGVKQFYQARIRFFILLDRRLWRGE